MSEYFTEYVDSIKTFIKLSDYHLGIKKKEGPFSFVSYDMNIKDSKCQFQVEFSRNNFTFMKMNMLECERVYVAVFIENIPETLQMFDSLQSYDGKAISKYDLLEFSAGGVIKYFQFLFNELDEFADFFAKHIASNLY